MILFRSQTIEFPYLDYSIVFIIADSIYEAKVELKIEYTEDDKHDIGQAVLDKNGIIYCIVVDDRTERLTVLHEAIHCINIMYRMIGAEISLDMDEIYVRQVSWLQDQVLGLWDAYYNNLVISNENSSN